MLELTLAITGVLLTILLSTPVLGAIERNKRDRKRREEWSARLHFDDGIITERDAFAWERWDEVLQVDSEGNAAHVINVTVVNRGEGGIDSFFFPVFGDRKHIRASELHPWARDVDSRLIAEVSEWDEEQSRGRINIALREPLKPAGRRSFAWGYTMPETFKPGDEYFSFDIAAPQYELNTTVAFSPDWKITYARWAGTLAATLEAPKLANNTISATAMFPRIAERVTLEFGLAKARK